MGDVIAADPSAGRRPLDDRPLHGRGAAPRSDCPAR